MKQALLAISFLLMGLFAKGQTTGSNCDRDSTFLNRYQTDINRLAVRAMRADPVLKDSIRIHQPLKDTIGKALAAVYNAQTPVTDSLFSFYKVQTGLKPRLSKITLELDSNALNLDSIQPGDKGIGISPIDHLMSQYKLRVTSINSDFNFPLIRMKSKNALNLTPLLKEMNAQEAIERAYEQKVAGDGSDINYIDTATNQKLNFLVKWGDCPSGCIFKRTYQFGIKQNCDVSTHFSGDPINNRHPKVDTGISAVFGPDRNDSFAYVFPNPIQDEFTLRVFKPIDRTQITIFKSDGTVVSEQAEIFPQIPSTMEFDLSGHPNGIYFMTLIGNQKQQLIKIIKTDSR